MNKLEILKSLKLEATELKLKRDNYLKNILD